MALCSISACNWHRTVDSRTCDNNSANHRGWPADILDPALFGNLIQMCRGEVMEIEIFKKPSSHRDMKDMRLIFIYYFLILQLLFGVVRLLPKFLHYL